MDKNFEKKLTIAIISIALIIILVTFKIWIKQTFELRALELAILIGLSWLAKYTIMKRVKAKVNNK